MVFEKLTDGLDEDILVHTLLQNLLNLALSLRLQDGCLLLEEQTHAVQRHYLQRTRAYDAIKEQVKLLDADIPDEAVEHPREDDSERLDLQLLEFGHQLLLCAPQQVLEKDAET